MFVLAYRDCGGANRVRAYSRRRYFLPRVKIGKYNIEIDGRIFYDQPINDLIINTMRLGKHRQDKVMITQLVVYWILLISKKNYRLIAADLSKQMALDADSSAI